MHVQLALCFIKILLALQVDMNTPLTDMYAALSWGDRWEDAEMQAVIRYLRGSMFIRIPWQWKRVLPTEL